MKIFLLIIALVNGGFMLADGIHVMLKGKYIGPPKPGPWSILFDKLHINVFQLGPVFVIYGVAWLVFAYGVWTGQDWTKTFGILLSILTLWYLPFGTLISIISLFILIYRYR